jgi:arylsulfatase A-like enzyme
VLPGGWIFPCGRGGYGGPDMRTPNIDCLARDGVRLTDFYANDPSCSPARAGLVTGRHPQRVAIAAPRQNACTSEEASLPSWDALLQLLKNGGYATMSPGVLMLRLHGPGLRNGCACSSG